MKLSALILMSASMMTVLLSGCTGVILPRNERLERVTRPDEEFDFSRLYAKNCSACHGVEGSGGPAISLANPRYQLLVDDASLRRAISQGVPGTQMPVFGEAAGGLLTSKQVDALVAGIRSSWRPKDAKPDPDMPPYHSNLIGQPDRGARLYQSDCISCHQKEGQSITNTAYLALVSDQGLRTVIVAGRPDLGHPEWTNPQARYTLSDQDATDLVSYLASLRSGASEQPYPKKVNR